MLRIQAARDSVCMGDDVTAPNADYFFFPPDNTTDDLLLSLCGYVPHMKNVVWEVICNKQIIGYLFSDETGYYQYESAGSCEIISELPSHSIFCKYYYESSDFSGNSFPDGTTLLERIKVSKAQQHLTEDSDDFDGDIHDPCLRFQR